MPLDRREQVFVSSTFLDLKDERQEVMQTLLEAGCIPAGMELFPASDDEKWELIRKVIDDCDYYLVVIGGKYGTVNPELDLSYTEMEFDYAESQSIPIMGFLHGAPERLAFDHSEGDPALRDKLNAFRTKVEVRMVKYWTSSKDLGGQVAKSLIKMRSDRPAEGWIRGRNAITPELEAEISGLRLRVAELTAALGEAHVVTESLSPHLSSGDEKYLMSYRLRYFTKDQVAKSDTYNSSQRTDAWYEGEVTWDDILFNLGPSLLAEATEEELDAVLDDIAEQLWLDANGPEPADCGSPLDVLASSACVNDVVIQFMALGLIVKSDRRRPISNTATYWTLTKAGNAHLIRVRAMHTSTMTEEAAPAKKTPAKKTPAKKTPAKSGSS